jgi:glycosyltransferase involved in cell wall biosynthesis
MRTSVVIPCFNEKDTIREIVGRVIEAAGPGAEIIIVDDGSTDGLTGCGLLI